MTSIKILNCSRKSGIIAVDTRL